MGTVWSQCIQVVLLPSFLTKIWHNRYILSVSGALYVKAIEKILIIFMVVILEAVPGASQLGACGTDDVLVQRGRTSELFSAI